VAFSTILLIGGGLYGRGLMKAYAVDLGFRSANLWTAGFNIVGPGPQAAQHLQNSQKALVRELSAMPGTIAASTTSRQLLGIRDRPAQVDSGTTANVVSAESEYTGPNYLAAMGIPLLSGREFSPRDDAAATPVAIVNRELANRLWPGGNPLGQTVWIHGRTGVRTPVTVVGVAHDAKYDSVWEQAQPHLYLADWQATQRADNLIVRSTLKPAELAAAVRQTWGRLEPSVSLSDFQTAGERVNLFLAPQRVAAGILGAFGLLAIVLASFGLYSLVAYSVLQQKREIGIRLAIGAQPRAVMSAILRRAFGLTAAGVMVGGAISLVLMRFLAAQVKEISPYDGATYLAVAALLGVIALLAALIPARRAMGIDPAVALRAE
jgi:predicted permease